MDPQLRRSLIDKYKDGYRVVHDALDGASDAELDARPAPGTWSSREIVHHLADSEMTAAIRLRLLIAQDRPVIAAYDQDEFARRLAYDRPITASLAAFKAAREATSEILERLTEQDWQREGTHTEIGRYPVVTWLEIYAAHAHAHAEQIQRARAAARRTDSGQS
jgi:hypothetical protein